MSYYTSKKTKLLKSFDKTANLTRDYVVSQYGEELADILEIVHGLAYHLNYDWKALEKVRKQKYEERGGFERGIKLNRVY